MYLVYSSLASSISPSPLDIDNASVEEPEGQSDIIEGLAHMSEIYLDSLGLEVGDLSSNDIVIKGVRGVGSTHVGIISSREVDGVDVREFGRLEGL